MKKEKVLAGNKLDWIFDYYESGHVCGIKPLLKNQKRRILCDCVVYYDRVPQGWYKPIYFLGKKIDFYSMKHLGQFNKISYLIDHYIVFRY